MSRLGMVQSDSSGKIVRVLSFPHEFEQYKDAPDVDQIVLVALTETNVANLRAIAQDADSYRIIAGVVKKGADTVTFEEGDDGHAAEKFLRRLTPAQVRGLRAGAKAVVTGLSAGSTNVEKAIGSIVLRLMELEE